MIARFLDEAPEESFNSLSELFTVRLAALYPRNCDPGLSEDLAQLVILTISAKRARFAPRRAHAQRPRFDGMQLKQSYIVFDRFYDTVHSAA